jgi:hypothetical protein
MTAEIAILNKNGIALAADSAVTLRNPDSQKVYNTANKLFMLSKFHPVGIMVYGSADLMGVPWETVIKMYRSELGPTNFDSLMEFAEHFIEFLDANRLLFPAALQESEFAAMCLWVLSQVQKRIDSAVQSGIAAQGGIDDERVTQIVGAIANEDHQSWVNCRRLDCFPNGFEDQLMAKYEGTLRGVIAGVFQQLPIDQVRDKLLQICAFRVTKEWWSLKSGGIVIAGFGRNEFLPVLHSFTVESITNDRLKHDRNPNLSNDMGESRSAVIIPFAQAEIVYRFIRGIDPDYKRELTNFLKNLLTVEYPEKIVADFRERTTEQQQRDVQAELIRIGRTIIGQFDDTWSAWEHRKFVGPVIDIVADLPKDDLAAMAESLVNLTSFKRRITAEAETVGGPIDVAVISKGDGFVWIKRKHYFQKDLNPAFFANYYRRNDDGV